MKFESTFEGFKECLARVISLSEASSKELIKRCVLVGVRDESCSLLCTNRYSYIKSTFNVDVSREGHCFVNAKILFDIINKLEGDFTATLNEFDLLVETKENQYSIPTHSDLEWNVPKRPRELRTVTSGPLFKKGLSQVCWAASPDDIALRSIESVNINCEDGNFEVVATDGISLAVFSEQSEHSDFSILIPSDSAVTLHKSLNEEEVVEINFNDDKTEFKFDNTSFLTTNSSQQYPSYKKLFFVPDNPIKINKKELSESLERLLVLTDKIKRKLTLELNDNEPIKIISEFARTPSIENLSKVYHGDNLKICIFGRDLNDMIKKIKTKELFIGIDIDKGTLRVTGEDDNNTVYYMKILRA